MNRNSARHKPAQLCPAPLGSLTTKNYKKNWKSFFVSEKQWFDISKKVNLLFIKLSRAKWVQFHWIAARTRLLYLRSWSFSEWIRIEPELAWLVFYPEPKKHLFMDHRWYSWRALDRWWIKYSSAPDLWAKLQSTHDHRPPPWTSCSKVWYKSLWIWQRPIRTVEFSPFSIN